MYSPNNQLAKSVSETQRTSLEPDTPHVSRLTLHASRPLPPLILAMLITSWLWPIPVRADGPLDDIMFVSPYTKNTESVAWGDADGDGDLDLAVGNGEVNQLYRNDGSGGFTVEDIGGPAKNTYSVAWGDADGDGDLDLAVGNYYQQVNQIYWNNGSDGFTPEDLGTAISTTHSVAWGDADGDGDLDLAVGNYEFNQLYRNDGSGGFTPEDIGGPAKTTYSVAWGDADGDGDLDLAVGNSGVNQLYWNDGSGGFTVEDIGGLAKTTESVAWGDADGDGDLDLAVGNGTASGQVNQLYWNDGSGGFTVEDIGGPAKNTYSVAWGDVDGDGDLDLAVGNQNQINQLYRNDGSSGFALQDVGTDAKPTRSVAWGDADGDGNLDLAVGNRGGVNLLHRNDRSGGFISENLGSGTITFGVAWGDADGDGDLDLAVGNYDQVDLLYWNNGSGGFIPEALETGVKRLATSMAWGDADGDGDLDLAVGNDEGINQLYRNEGSDGFNVEDIGGSTRDTTSVAWGDADGDGDLDLAVGNYYQQASQLYWNNGDGSFTLENLETDPKLTTSVAWGDADADGDLDLAVGNREQVNQLYRNDGSGGFSPEDLGIYPRDTSSVAWGDADGDGDLDLAVGNDEQANQLYRNDGSGGFTPEDLELDAKPTTSVAWGDADGDGDLDLAVGNDGEANQLYWNDGSGGFTPRDLGTSISTTTSVAWGDADGDGDLDLAVGNAGWPGEVNQLTLSRRPAHPLHPDQAAAMARHGVALGLSSDPVQIYSGEMATALAPADFYATPGIRWDGVIPITYTLFHPANRPMGTVNAFYSLDGGDHWITATAAPDTLTRTLGTVSAVKYRSNDAALPLFLPADSPVSSTLLITTVRRIVDLDVWLSITRTSAANLDAALISPQGTVIELFSNVEGSGYDFRETILDDQAPITITASEPPFTGRFRPTGHLTDLDGKVISGTWTLVVTDTTEGTALLAWGVILNSGSPVAYASQDPLPISIPDNGAVRTTLLISETQPILDVNVWLNITHTRAADLDIFLVSPSGTVVELFSDVGGDGDNFVNTILDDQAIRSITVITPGMAPFSGFFEPEGRLADFDSESPNGTWELRVTDDLAGETGLIANWGILLQTAGEGTHVYHWDVFGSGLFGQSDNVVFRLEAYPVSSHSGITGTHRYLNAIPGPYQRPFVSAQTFPFRVRGTQVLVLNDAVPVANALVYQLPTEQTTGGTFIADSAGNPFRTDSQGYLQGRGELEIGDRLMALLPIAATDTYTLYYTSATPTLTGLDAYTVTTAGVQTLTVSADNPLILFNLDVSLEWDAHNDTIYLDQLAFNLQRASEYLYDFSNGQAALGHVNVFQNGDEWVYSHVVVQANNRLRPFAAQGGIVVTDTLDPDHDTPTDTILYSPGQVTMGSTWNRYGNPGQSLGEDWPIILAHELGHYLLFHDDTYIGLDPSGFLVPVTTCLGSAMGDLYSNPDNTEFIADEGYWQANCAETLAEQTLERNEWETMQLWYEWLISPTAILSGPTTMPFDFSTVRIHDPYTPTDTLIDPTFYIDYQGGGGSSSEARAYLDRDDYVVNLGSPFGGQNRVIAHGARPGDRLCIFDRPRAQFGCETIEIGDDRLAMRQDSDWNPIVQISPINSTTLTINFSNTVPIAYPLRARIFPDLGYGEAPITLTLSGGVYSGTFSLTYPAMSGNVQVWVDEPAAETNPRREAVVAYSIGGNLGTMRGGGGTMRGGGGTMRGGGGTMRGGGGTMRGGGAPIVSPDGQMIFFTENPIDFTVGTFFTIQGMAGLPPLPPGRTLVGQGYNLVASPGVSLPFGSVSIQYLSNDVLVAGASEEDLTLYFWDGASWTALDTVLDTYFNLVSAPSQGEGVYALMASVKIPLYGPGWNLFAYSVHATQPVTAALLSIQGSYTTVYGYEPTDTTDPWKVYDTGVPTYVNDLHALEFGKGYWINVSQSITLHLPSGVSPQAADRSATADTMPLPPATFYGAVLAGNGFTPIAGMTVTAWVLPDNTLCGQGRTREWNERIVYVVDVFADGDPGNSMVGCGASGRTVRFEISQQATSTTAVWDNRQLWHLDLSMVSAQYHVYLPLVIK